MKIVIEPHFCDPHFKIYIKTECLIRHSRRTAWTKKKKNKKRRKKKEHIAYQICWWNVLSWQLVWAHYVPIHIAYSCPRHASSSKKGKKAKFSYILKLLFTNTVIQYFIPCLRLHLPYSLHHTDNYFAIISTC